MLFLFLFCDDIPSYFKFCDNNLCDDILNRLWWYCGDVVIHPPLNLWLNKVLLRETNLLFSFGCSTGTYDLVCLVYKCLLWIIHGVELFVGYYETETPTNNEGQLVITKSFSAQLKNSKYSYCVNIVSNSCNVKTFQIKD